ncbi:MAG: chemotaxis protein CheX [Thermodesulfobacteriota bacterium]|nr:chemotaxis protein CheX [Thermodesulfobacteriota bacterium]
MMEKQTLITAMKNSISSVLETMFFLPLDFSDTDDRVEVWSRDQRGVVISKMNFHGPFKGHFIFLLPEELAMSLAASFMGKDDESISQDHVIETAKEIINMIAGNTFSNYDDQAVFHLDIPQLIHFNEVYEADSSSEEALSITINTLGNRFALRMVIINKG